MAGLCRLGSAARAIAEAATRLGISLPKGRNLDALFRRLLDEEGRELLFELIGAVAHRLRRTKDASDFGLPANEVREIVAVSNSSMGPDSSAVRRLRMVLIRFAFFGPGRRAGSIDFTHQILADYFAARYATSMLERALKSADSTGEALKRHGQDLVIRAIGTAPVISGSLFYRYFVQALEKTLSYGAFWSRSFGPPICRNKM